MSASRLDIALRRFTVLALAGLLVLIGTASTWNIVRQHARPEFWTDFTADYVSANAYLDGTNPYGSSSALEHRYVTPIGSPPGGLTANPHPPAHVALAIPIARVSYTTARAIWVSGLALAFVIGLALVLRELRASWLWAVSIAIGCLWLRVSRISLLTAQIDGLLLLLIVLGWVAIKRGRDRSAGVALGIATALKFFPLFLLIPLLSMRRWRIAKWQVGTSIVLTVATSALLGTSAVWAFVTRAAPQNLRNWAAAPHNLSLTAVPLRWLTVNRWRPEAPDLRILAFPLVLAILLICGIAAGRSPARVSGDKFLAAIPWMLLAIPLFWPNELVLILPIVAVIASRYGLRGLTTRPWPLVAAAVLLWGSPYGFIDSPVPAWSQVVVWMAASYALVWLAVSEWSYRNLACEISDDPTRRARLLWIPRSFGRSHEYQ